MSEINLSNPGGRDAIVEMTSVRTPLRVRWLDAKGRQASSVRILKATIDRDFEALRARFGSPADVGKALLEDDPEIDFEIAGRFLSDTSRVYVDGDRSIVHKAQWWEIVRNPDGSERERRPRKVAEPNIATGVPLKWSGVFLKKDEIVRKVVFTGKMQLLHINGLTYDFLYGMAKELEERNSLMVLGAGPKGNQPLLLRRGATPYRGFLEGRTDGDRYRLVLHLSNLELKAPSAEESE